MSVYPTDQELLEKWWHKINEAKFRNQTELRISHDEFREILKLTDIQSKMPVVNIKRDMLMGFPIKVV